MSEHTHDYMIPRPHLGLLDRAAVLAALALGLALFLTIGWMTVAPPDPLGAVSIYGRPGGRLILMQAAGLAAVTAALATTLAGRKLADIGTFAVGVGLAAASLRGGSAAQLMIDGPSSLPDFRSTLARGLAVEAIDWFLVIAVAILAETVVLRWLIAPYAKRRDPDEHRRASAGEVMPSLLRGLQHTAVTAVVGFFAVTILSSGAAYRSVSPGQACFVSAAGMAIGTYAAHRIAPVGFARWSILAVPVVALAGYLWAAWGADSPGRPPVVPLNPFLRVLPIQFIAVGTASAVAAAWYLYGPSPSAEDQSTSHPAPEPPT
jgi:hypothetical protein